MVEEEAEVFRKGTVLLGPEEMEGEYAGEELRIEVSSEILFSKETREKSNSCLSLVTTIISLQKKILSVYSNVIIF